MNRFLKAVTILLSLILVMSFVVGCNPDGNKNSPTPTPPATETPGTTTEPLETPGETSPIPTDDILPTVTPDATADPLETP